ncbi:MAG: hypothetical protein WKG01_07760 [Kofleriaceae bacterium]
MAISDKLARIQQQANELNAKSDQFNSTITTIEEGLNGSGVEFWWVKGGRVFDMRDYTAASDSGDPIKRHEYYHLGYAKLAGVWCLAVERWTGQSTAKDNWGDDKFDDAADGSPCPLQRAPRRVRIAVAGHLEEFLDALSVEIDAMTSAVAKANALVNDEDDFTQAMTRQSRSDKDATDATLAFERAMAEAAGPKKPTRKR